MSKELFCAAVKDLLPSYIEGLTSSETCEAIEIHLQTCADCKRLHDTMMTDNITETKTLEKEIDYLKIIRKRSRQKIALGIIIPLALILLVSAIKVFLIGWPVYSIAYSVASTGDEIVISGDLVDSSRTVRKVNISQVNGNAYVTVYACFPSFLTDNISSFYERIPDDGVNAIYLGKANAPKETMWLQNTSSYVGQTSLSETNIKVGQLIRSDRSIVISSSYPPEVSYNMAWLPLEQTISLYLVSADGSAEVCVASESGGKAAGTLDLTGISDGTYYFAIRNSGTTSEQFVPNDIESVLVQIRYINYAEQLAS